MMMLLVQLQLIILVEQTLLYHSGWIVCNAQDQRRFWMTAVFQDGGLTAVLITLMMLELCVQTVSLISNCMTLSLLHPSLYRLVLVYTIGNSEVVC